MSISMSINGVEKVKFEDFQLELLKFLKPFWSRVISFDVETHVIGQGYLTNERILAIGIARRTSGDFMKEKGIEVKILWLEEDNEDAEIELLRNFCRELSRIKPLGVIGYGIRQYDMPLMAIKKQRYEAEIKKFSEYWKLVDFVESTLPIDLYHILKFKFKSIRRLEDVANLDDAKKIFL